ncbi:unnamed protein product [Polarella glacialis]|uniref:Uncharacterized protein n=1 Tax=Polarella glacialis TaxID=89957 RepID=A0A813K5J4_POLGL|nr:unnamed protein product [Polarella glacialis]
MYAACTESTYWYLRGLSYATQTRGVFYQTCLFLVISQVRPSTVNLAEFWQQEELVSFWRLFFFCRHLTVSRIVSASGLVGRDWNWFRDRTSDPFCEVTTWPKMPTTSGVYTPETFTTARILKSLDPVWDHTHVFRYDWAEETSKTTNVQQAYEKKKKDSSSSTPQSMLSRTGLRKNRTKSWSNEHIPDRSSELKELSRKVDQHIEAAERAQSMMTERFDRLERLLMQATSQSGQEVRGKTEIVADGQGGPMHPFAMPLPQLPIELPLPQAADQDFNRDEVKDMLNSAGQSTAELPGSMLEELV